MHPCCYCYCRYRHRDTTPNYRCPPPKVQTRSTNPGRPSNHAHTTSHVAALPNQAEITHTQTHTKPSLSNPNKHASYQHPSSNPIQLQLPSRIRAVADLYRTPIHTRTQTQRQNAIPPAPHQQLPPDMWPQPRPRPQRSPRTRISTSPTSVLYRDRHQPLLAAHTTPILPSHGSVPLHAP